MKRRKQKLIEREEYPFCQPIGIELPKRKLQKQFEIERKNYRKAEESRKTILLKMITEISKTQKLRQIELNSSTTNSSKNSSKTFGKSAFEKMGKVFTFEKCNECGKESNSLTFKICQSCENKICQSCVFKQPFELNNKTIIDIPLCNYCHKMFWKVNQIIKFKQFVKIANEHQNVTLKQTIQGNCISFAEELLTLDLFICLALSKQPPDKEEMINCNNQLIIVQAKQRKVFQIDQMIKTCQQCQLHSDETIRLNIIRAFKIFLSSVVYKSLNDISHYEKIINKHIGIESVPEVLDIEPTVLPPSGGQLKLLITDTNDVQMKVNGKEYIFVVENDFVVVDIPPMEHSRKIDLQLFYKENEIPLKFEIEYLIDSNSIQENEIIVLNDNNEIENEDNQFTERKELNELQINEFEQIEELEPFEKDKIDEIKETNDSNKENQKKPKQIQFEIEDSSSDDELSENDESNKEDKNNDDTGACC